jgi:hypothetical protein
MAYAHTPSRLAVLFNLVCGIIGLAFSAGAIGSSWLQIKVDHTSIDFWVIVFKGLCEEDDISTSRKDCTVWGDKDWKGTDFADDGNIIWPAALILAILALVLTLASFIVMGLALTGVITTKKGQKIAAPLYLLCALLALVAVVLAVTSNLANPQKWKDENGVDVHVYYAYGLYLEAITFVSAVANAFVVALPGCCGLCAPCVAEEAPFKSIM